MKYIVATVMVIAFASASVAGPRNLEIRNSTVAGDTFDPIHSLEHCYKQQFPACSGGGDGGGN